MSKKSSSRIGIDPFVDGEEIKTVKGVKMTGAKSVATELTLEGVVDIGKVTDLKVGLAGMLDSGSDIKIDAGAVEKLDGASLQLLVAFVQESRQRGCGLEWSAVSEVLKDGARLLGLSQELNLPA